MNLRINCGLNFSSFKPAKNNSSLFKPNAIKADIFSFCSKKQEDLNLCGTDYSMLDSNYIRRTKTVPQLIQDNKEGIDISKDRDALICSRIKIAIKDAKAFCKSHPRFDYNDVCQELILCIIDSTDKELKGNKAYSASIHYIHNRDRYFASLLKTGLEEIPFNEKHKKMQMLENELKCFDELENNDLRHTLDDFLDNIYERDRIGIELYFGLNDDEPKSLETAAKEFGIHRERVRKIILRGLGRLVRNPVREKALKDFY